MADYFLGVDAGGSRTRAVLASDSGEVLGIGYGGSANFRTGLFAVAAAAVQEAVSQAIASAGVKQVAAVCIGSAGLEAPGNEAEGRQLLGDIIQADKVILDTDAYIAWAGALELQPGVIVIAGTGSICLGVDAEGKRYRVGGWGPQFGDEGSAYAIARAAMGEALKTLDGRKQNTALLASLLDFADLSLTTTAAELTTWLYALERSPAKIACFSPKLDELARQGDAAAQKVLLEAGFELAQLAVGVVKGLEAPLRISIGGSVLIKNAFVKEAFLRYLANHHQQYIEPTFPPVLGAVLLALDTKLRPSEDTFKTLKKAKIELKT